MDRKKEMQEEMSRFHKIAEKLSGRGLDAMMVTSGPNRLYAGGFASSAGMAIVTEKKTRFSDLSRPRRRTSRARTSRSSPGRSPCWTWPRRSWSATA